MRAVILLAFATLFPAWPNPTQTDANLPSMLISMTREGSGLFGLSDPRDLRQDASYSVSIAGDGTVTYVGRVGVRTLGMRTHKTTVDAVRALVSEFEQTGFWSLADRYEAIDMGNGVFRTVSDLAKTTVRLSVDGKSKSVYDYYGTPAVVKRLEDRLDEVADSRRYTGRLPNKRLQPTASAVFSR